MSELLNTRECFLEATRRRIRKIRLESLGQEVCIKPLTGIERARIGDAYRELGDNASFQDTSRRIGYQTIAFALVDEKGERIFSDEDLDVIGNIDAAALDEISDAIQKSSGLASDSVESAIKYSVPPPSGGSTSV